MANDWIIRFEVWVLDGSDPMYGHDSLLKSFDNYDPALAYAKGIAKREDNVCVKRVRYASERNLSKRFSFDSHIAWAKWIDGIDSDGDESLSIWERVR